MNKTITIITLLFVCSCILSCKKKSDSGTVIRNKRIIEGQFYSNYGYESLCKTTENNVVIIAQKGSPSHLYVAMMNSSLDILWEKTFASEIDNAGGITASSDGGVVIASDQYVPNSMHDVDYCLNLKKLNSKGDLQWEKNYWFNSGFGHLYPIRQTSDKGFIIGVAYFISDTSFLNYPTLFKVSEQGDSLWSKGVPGLFNCIGFDIGLAPDGGFLVSGPCSVYKTDSLGNLEWHNEDAYDATTLQVLQDGSVVVLKQKDVIFGNYSILYRADANGIKAWEMMYTDGYVSGIYNLCISKENGFVFTESYFGILKLIKTDNKGNKLSETRIEGYISMGIVLVENKYCCYCYEYNTSAHCLNLVINLVD